MQSFIERVVSVAEGEVGVLEHGENRGRRVEEYQAADTLSGGGYAWCASFVAWCMLQAFGKSLVRQVWFPSASCDEVLRWARDRGIVSTKPTPGCAGLVMASRFDATHIFLVSRLVQHGFYTVEGNTNDNGSREGIGVFARYRGFSTRYLFVNWARLFPVSAWDATHAPKPGTVKVQATKPAFGQVPFYFRKASVAELHKAGDLILSDGKAWVPAWKWSHWIGAELGWNVASQSVFIAGREVAAQPLMLPDAKGARRAWVPIRTVAEMSGFDVEYSDGQVIAYK